MRMSRYASFLPVVLVMAGCNASEPVDSKSGESIFVAEGEQAEYLVAELAMQSIAERPELGHMQVADVAADRIVIDEDGEAHARVMQKFGGIPVFAAEAVVHLGRDGMLNSITDNFVQGINVNTTPAISAREALELATIEMGGKDLLLGEPKVDLQILRQRGKDHLTFRVQLEMRTIDDEPTMPVVFVDAHTSEVVWSYDNLQTAKNRSTYTAKSTQTLPGTLLRTEGQAPVSDAVANQAHDNAGFVWDYYSARHGRDSFDGAGALIKSSVHYKKNYVNAFWNGTQMVYGDGDGSQSGPLTVLDVVGHEITHAVTERSSNLVYSTESGALNEAMSDIFGASIEAFRDGAVSGNTWKIGEECWTPATAGDSLRQMDDPGLYGDYDYYPTRYTGTSDNGGVHWNSGIANLAFALMVKGGVHPRGKTSNNVPAIDANQYSGIQKAAAIFYRANTQCLTSGSTFQDARGCTEAAANALYGSTAAASVTAAWQAVGVPAPLVWTQRDSQGPISAGTNVKTYFTLVTPAGAKALKFSTSGGTGDADLYVRYGSNPTTATYTCRSAGATSAESCTINNPSAGTYYVMINAYTAISGVNYKAESGQ
jgi:bacillolysin